MNSRITGNLRRQEDGDTNDQKKGRGKRYLRVMYTERPETKKIKRGYLLSREEMTNNEHFSEDLLSISTSRDWLGRGLGTT